MYREQMSKAGMVAVQIHDRLWSWQGDRLYRLLVAGLLGTLVLSAVLLWTGFRSPDDRWETVAGSRAAVGDRKLQAAPVDLSVAAGVRDCGVV